MLACFRSIIEQDWGDIDLIQRKSYPLDAQENIDAMRCHWRLSPDTCRVAERDCQIIGYALSHPWTLRRPPAINVIYDSLSSAPDSLYLHDVALSPHARGTGLATMLVNQVLAIADHRGLNACALISVQKSRRFWERFGFQVESNLPSDFFDAAHTHYRDPDCMYMIRLR